MIMEFEPNGTPDGTKHKSLEDLGWAVQAEKLCNLYRAVLE
jgi:hypothetical protein